MTQEGNSGRFIPTRHAAEFFALSNGAFRSFLHRNRQRLPVYKLGRKNYFKVEDLRSLLIKKEGKWPSEQ